MHSILQPIPDTEVLTLQRDVLESALGAVRIPPAMVYGEWPNPRLVEQAERTAHVYGPARLSGRAAALLETVREPRCVGGCGRPATADDPWCCSPCRRGEGKHTAGCDQRSGR